MIGMRIKQLREHAELSQSDLAKQLGISQPMVAQWEKGTRPISLNYLSAVTVILNCSADYLLTGENKCSNPV